MTRADHATGTDRVAEVAAQLEGARIIVNLQGDEPEISGAGARPRRRAARERPRGADGHARDPDPRRVDLSRPGVRQGRLLPARAVRSTSRAARSPAIATASPIRHAPRGRSPISTWASTRIAATSCWRSARSPLPRSRPPRSSSSSACSTPATRSPSASSTSRASASTRPRTTVGSSSAGGGPAEVERVTAARAAPSRLATETPLNSGGTAMSND